MELIDLVRSSLSLRGTNIEKYPIRRSNRNKYYEKE